MSIAQKSSTTWLPRFWRKPESVPMDDVGLNDIEDAAAEPADAFPRPGAATDMPSRTSGVALSPDVDDAPSVEENIVASVIEPAPVPVVPLPKPVIHALACVEEGAVLEDGVEVGPFCFVGPHVRLGQGTRLLNNVTVTGHTTLGQNNLVFPNAVLGSQPQDKKFGGEATRLEIGDNNHFREAVTIHVGTAKGGGVTRIGSGNLLMVNCHIGHDVVIGNNCIFANNVMLAGHVHIGNAVVLSGCVGVHHFVTVGDYAYSAGMCKLTHDVPPYVKVDEKDRVRGVNSVGLRRNGFSENDVSAIEQAIWCLFLDRAREPVNSTLRKMRSGALLPEVAKNTHVQRVMDFLERRNLGRHGRYLESMRAG